MTNAGAAEIYFIAGMMILFVAVSAGSIFLFFRQMKREKKTLLTKTKKSGDREKHEAHEAHEKAAAEKDYVEK